MVCASDGLDVLIFGGVQVRNVDCIHDVVIVLSDHETEVG